MAKKSFISTKTVFRVITVLIILGLAGATGFYYKKYNDLKNSSPEKIQEAQNKSIIDEVAKVYALPGDETPVVGKVSDKEAIKKQYPVLDSVENGDYLLIYQKAKKAVLYRPSTKQVIKEIPVSVEASVKLKVVGSAAERQAVEKTLNDNKITYADGGVAKTAISGVTVVDVSGKNAETAKTLAEKVGGTVGSLPAGEDKPSDADLAIFVGPTASVTP